KNKSLALTVSDTAKIKASGSSDSVTAVMRDAGELDASRLDTEEASVTASGRSSGVFLARGSLNVMSSGDARVEYLGGPLKVNKATSDGSRLVPRRGPPPR